MVAGQDIQYSIDLVICIDATGSMEHLIEGVKASALTFHEKLQQKMTDKSKPIGQLRVKVIVFRDYWVDAPDQVMICSDFFNLPEESSSFSNFISKIKHGGGGDEPENALEALALAIRSPWSTEQSYEKGRYVILMFTDASAHPLERSPKPSHYPSEMPKNFDELTDEWVGLPLNKRRLVVFAPETTPWLEIEEDWENVFFFTSVAGEGLEESDMDYILGGLAASCQ